MKKTYLLASILLLTLAISGFFLSGIFGSNYISHTVTVTEKPIYHATLTVLKNGDLIDYIPNLLTNLGAEFVEQQLRAPQSLNKTNWISVSNVSGDCVATATKLANELTTMSLARASCTQQDLGTGNYSCEKTFTATGSVAAAQIAGLNYNSTMEPSLFACSTFTSVNLEKDDQLTLRWNITIS